MESNKIINGYCVTDKEKPLYHEQHVLICNEQDYKMGLQYWSDLLEGYNDSVNIMPMQTSEKVEGNSNILKIELPDNLNQDIVSLAEKVCVSVSTVFEIALGLLLQRYNYTNDVIFVNVK